MTVRLYRCTACDSVVADDVGPGEPGYRCPACRAPAGGGRWELVAVDP